MNEQNPERTGPVARVLLGFVRAYQKLLSPFLGSNCRYYPSCSHYTYEAIEIHGPVKGSWFGMKRIGRCHPFHEGGLDPVPGSSDSVVREPQGSTP